MQLCKFFLATVYCTCMLCFFFLDARQYREIVAHFEVPLAHATVKALSVLGLIPGAIALIKIIDDEVAVTQN